MSRALTKTAVMHAADVNRFVFYCLLAVVFYAIIISQAHAAWDMVLCGIATFVYGNLGRGLATLAVMIVGAGACLGKVSWGLAITVAVGISVVFNAGDIVVALGGLGC